MASIVARKSQEKLADSLFKKTHFCKQEVLNLLSMFSEEVKPKDKMDRTSFREILRTRFSMTDDMLMDRVYRAFDKDTDSFIKMEDWIVGLSVFLRGTLEEKTKFCFEVYDLNGDNYISKEEIMQLLKNTIIKQPTEEDPDEGIRELGEIIIKTMDGDHDGKLSYSDFKTAVEGDHLLLEAFGQCLPTEEDTDKFIDELKDDKEKQGKGPSSYKPKNEKK
ncbi:EF-hand calcium-binding domain-containing protein 1-like [Actinia tenebrosa]|uniref:EF-hand calcium-binding domain-containing protein 1-like n=1 Tax=Actinia tenebrosa TaxID=6105 RepID=A0A6P8I007_ACTTE|nr:EF-hand calcium-binding domain-containing protein 1-like [Actinia tenebrosa]